MNQRPALVLTRYENATGTTSWRVSGQLNGIRVRKNFKSRDEAEGVQAVDEGRAMNGISCHSTENGHAERSHGLARGVVHAAGDAGAFGGWVGDGGVTLGL